MSLPHADIVCLTERGLQYVVSAEANMTCIVFPSYQLPPGYDRSTADLLLRLQPGFPDVPPDMWWFNPGLRRADGTVILATEVVERHLGRDWQRWSRHFNAGQWRAGVDSIESFLALIRRELERCARH
jgi:Prokaryotic E2 family E